MVNEEARRERHAKLKQEHILLKNHSLNPLNGTSTAVKSAIQQICRDQNNNPLLGRLLKRIVGLTLAFLLITPFISTYQLAEGSYAGQFGEEELNLEEYTDESSEYTISDVMTEDGFLLKPAINSTEGDRSGFSDIFMYTVEPGDTLSSIAQSFNLKKETIMGENNIWNPNQIRVGSTLRILPVDGLSHKVKKGDTLDSLAKKYKVEKDDIIKQNQIEDETLIADSTIIVPGAKAEQPVYVATSSGSPGSVANYTGPSATGRLLFPTIGKITQGYHSGHLAIDIGNRNHAPIYAAAAGKVIKASYGWNGGYGNVVIIDHGNGMQTLYGHNDKLYVTEGQYVEQGQTIAWMGNTGHVYGPTGIHCHFEVRIKGVKYNPMNFF
jgi:murein DD-endopeptidase MepM/ murein hydrolase activator NlpD